MKKIFIVIMFVFGGALFSQNSNTIFIEAESFSDKGGWVVDQQSIDVMGSSYLMAHGLGEVVADANTSFNVAKAGNYKIWVRTRDWVAPWNVEGAPGKFEVRINKETIPTIFGTKGVEWNWHAGGEVELKKGMNSISLRDLTGFNGRCDAIVLSKDKNFQPPNELDLLTEFRQHKLGYSSDIEMVGDFDLVVVGGGIAGITSAISASRLGLKVALIQNRPVLGGNNSSEVRVGLSGLIYQEPYVNLGSLVDELGAYGHWTLYEANQNKNTARSKKIFEIIKNNPEKKEHNAGPASNYEDDRKLEVVLAEENISLFLNTHVMGADREYAKIIAVTGMDILTGKKRKFRGDLFVDCTGDGTLGYLVGADFRVGRESKLETGEQRAPEKSDKLVMGTSVQWNSFETEFLSEFPDTSPWSVGFDEKTSIKVTKGDWDWETGANRDQIKEIEFIRDYALRVTFGNWDFIKNKSNSKNKFLNRKLSWVAYIGGKRESRRLLGDIILQEQDIDNHKKYEDGSFTTTWGIDLHYPIRKNGFTGEAFNSRADIKEIEAYQVPYRCLYSRNIDNLFMAGRNISTTHVAMGTTRVQRTTGMMGEVVGMAASICKNKNASPREVYENYLLELKKLMEIPIGKPTW